MNLQWITLGDRTRGPHVLITGGVHGDEFEPMVAIRQLASELANQPLRGAVTLVPVVNEAAFRRGDRVAEDGLDLARTCPGREDGSITEQTAATLTKLIQSADVYIDLHTGGTRLQVYPLTGYMLHPNRGVYLRQQRMASVFGLPIMWGTDPNLNGRSLSVARDANVPAIYAEFLGGGGCEPRGVAAYVRGCRNILIDMDVRDGKIELPATRPLQVEDARPNAGFKQIQHPSPHNAYYHPALTLGQRVRAGDAIGTVCDPLGNTRQNILAMQNGIILVLRTFPSVHQKDSLAVILETDTDPVPWT
ncbi:MAG: M14 family metallopeptidase [Planctomycetaceae bacterium]|nr:M14 family metallopeptidase [Planctomycetaceae bacterium]